MWEFQVTVKYGAEGAVSVIYPTLAKALEIAAFVIDSPTALCPLVTVQRVRVS